MIMFMFVMMAVFVLVLSLALLGLVELLESRVMLEPKAVLGLKDTDGILLYLK